MANDWKPRPGSQAELFLRLAAPDSNGYSRQYTINPTYPRRLVTRPSTRLSATGPNTRLSEAPGAA